MQREQIDRHFCDDCGSETELVTSADTDYPDIQLRCCRYCGYQVEMRQPDDHDVTVTNFRGEAIHAHDK